MSTCPSLMDGKEVLAVSVKGCTNYCRCASDSPGDNNELSCTHSRSVNDNKWSNERSLGFVYMI